MLTFRPLHLLFDFSQMKSPGVTTSVNGSNKTLYIHTVKSIEEKTKHNLKKSLKGIYFVLFKNLCGYSTSVFVINECRYSGHVKISHLCPFIFICRKYLRLCFKNIFFLILTSASFSTPHLFTFQFQHTNS